MKILFLAPYPPGESPSQRYRFEHYLPFLEQNNISYTYKAFLSERSWNFFFQPGYFFQKLWGLTAGFFKRWILMFSVPGYDYIYIHREVAPIGPPVFEWIIAKLLRKKIIYDFDDAIWIPVASAHNKVAMRLKWFSKVRAICRWSHRISVGNRFLAEFAAKYNKNTFVVPTVVDTEHVHNEMQDQTSTHPVVGWTGTFSTLKYLDIVLPVLRRLQEKIDFTFVVIANKDPRLPLKKYRFIPWKKKTEIQDLLTMHIGLMPLYDNTIEKGKCGFKAIQYMSLGISAVVSPVGVNEVIVNHGVQGYTCSTEQEWENRLTILLQDSNLRRQMGAAARKKIEEHYSVKATKDLFLSLFNG